MNADINHHLIGAASKISTEVMLSSSSIAPALILSSGSISTLISLSLMSASMAAHSQAPIASAVAAPVAAPRPIDHTVVVSNAVVHSLLLFHALLRACPGVARFFLERVGSLTPCGPLQQP
jgi:membrane-bound metal-dependent hydrolase YbcI (DUF457 family)